MGACGLMSRNASVRSDSATRVAGTSPATILQNRQSGTGPILTCDVLSGLATYMVATLLTSSAPRACPVARPRCLRARGKAGAWTLLPSDRLLAVHTEPGTGHQAAPPPWCDWVGQVNLGAWDS